MWSPVKVFYGSQIPSTSEIRNYLPIDAELAVSIKPLVSGNGQVTLDINVIQSDFSSDRIEADAPPGLTSREFSSIIRMQNQDLAILGGLEEKVKNDSGSGVPFLARIPIIKWLFSQRKAGGFQTKVDHSYQTNGYLLVLERLKTYFTKGNSFYGMEVFQSGGETKFQLVEIARKKGELTLVQSVLYDDLEHSGPK